MHERKQRKSNMIFDYNTLEYEIIPNFKGGEKETAAKMFVDENNRILQGKLIPGATIGFHKHEGNSEIIYIIEGNGAILEDDGQTRPLSAGMCHYCAKGEAHSLINNSNEDLLFFAVVPEHGKNRINCYE